MLGALLGGISFHKGLGVIHSLSHALGSEGRAHHGTLNAILLPHALRFNREAARQNLEVVSSEGTELEALVNDLYKIPEPIVRKARTLMGG